MLKAKGFGGATGSEVADQMDQFFEAKPNPVKENIHHLQLKMGRLYNESTEKVDTHVAAVMVYDETAQDKAIRGTQ